MSKKSKSEKKTAKAVRAVARAESLVEHPNNIQYLRTQLHLSEPAERYLHILANPCAADPVGMPYGFPAKSLKMKTFIRSTFSTGSTSYGMVLLAPGAGVCNNQAQLWKSDSSFVANYLTNGGTGVGFSYSNSTFAGADIGTTANLAQYRLVSCCLRVRYAGTELNRGGTVIGFSHPDHQSLLNYGETDLLASEGAVRYPVTDKEWTELVYNGPIAPEETEYVVDYSAGTVGYTNPMMGFLVKSAAASQPFLVEVWSNYELIGSIARGKTENLIDPVGATMVTNAMTEAQQAHGGDATHHGKGSFLKSFLYKVGELGLKTLTYAAPVATTMRVGQSLLGRGGGVDKFLDQGLKKLLPALTSRTLASMPLLAAAV